MPSSLSGTVSGPQWVNYIQFLKELEQNGDLGKGGSSVGEPHAPLAVQVYQGCRAQPGVRPLDDNATAAAEWPRLSLILVKSNKMK